MPTLSIQTGNHYAATRFPANNSFSHPSGFRPLLFAVLFQRLDLPGSPD
jgi:hypothetical protein